MTTSRSHLRSVLFTLLMLCAAIGTAKAQVPANLAFQGLLTDENGVPLPSGDYSISFRIYPVETGGTALWTEVQSVSVEDGVANAVLGRINPLTLAFDDPYWLGITIGQNPTELSPRIPMAAAAYALNARGVEDGAISTAKLADDAVTAAKIADGAIETAAIQDRAVGITKIATDGASAGQTLVFQQGQLVWGAPSGEGVISEIEAGPGLEGGGTTGAITMRIAEEGVTKAMLRLAAVDTDQLANASVNEDKLANGAVTAAKIPAGELPLGKLSTTGAEAGEAIIFNGNSAGWRPVTPENGSIETAMLADGAVTGRKIFTTGATPNEILTYDGTNVVWAPASGVGAGSIGTTELADAAVTEAKLADAAVGSAKVADGAVGSAKLANLAVTTQKIDAVAVTSDKIADASITGAKIADAAVTTAKLGPAAVTGTELADASVGLAKIDVSGGLDDQVLSISGGAAVWSDAGSGLSPGSVGETELADNAVSPAKIQTGAVTAGKIFDGAVGNAALADGAVDNSKIALGSIDPTTRLDVTGASDGHILVFSGGLLTWTNAIPGDLTVTGTIDADVVNKNGGSFKIDHPLDPENKYLFHSFVESDEMMNMYSGNAELDADGRAVVVLPEWFEAANIDFRYQLTCIGGYSPVFIEREIRDGEFVIAGGTPGLRVSWQITAVRNDTWARHNRMKVEVDKPADERGTYYNPQGYNQ
jgi:hypothetical protein